jgi:endogenous inhibitor of DNA gyrase (YacG/DUF329 family)
MSLSTWLASSYVVFHMVVVVVCRCSHGCRHIMSLSTWLLSSYVVVHIVVVVLCRCPHGCRRLISLSTWLSSSYVVVHMVVSRLISLSTWLSSSVVVVHMVVVVFCRFPHQTKDRVTRTPWTTMGERMCSRGVSSSCSTGGTRCANLDNDDELPTHLHCKIFKITSIKSMWSK